jgi:uncharacterized membrane protein YgcG
MLHSCFLEPDIHFAQLQYVVLWCDQLPFALAALSIVCLSVTPTRSVFHLDISMLSWTLKQIKTNVCRSFGTGGTTGTMDGALTSGGNTGGGGGGGGSGSSSESDNFQTQSGGPGPGTGGAPSASSSNTYN